MSWFKRKKSTYEITPEGKKLVKLELGKITYIFDKDSVIVDLRANKEKPGVAIKKLVLDTGKVSVAQVLTIGIAQMGHELGHAGTVIAVKGKIQDIVLLGQHAGVRYIVDSAAAGMAVAIVPSVMEALLGLYLIRRGLKKESAISFSVGVMAFTLPLWRYVLWNLAAHSTTDYNLFAENLKQFLIDNKVGSFTTISSLDSNAIILLTLGAIYGGTLLGSAMYSKLIKDKIEEAKKELKYWRNVRVKIKEFKMHGQFSGWIPLNHKKATALLKSLRTNEKLRQ